MEDAPKNLSADATKGPNTQLNPGSGPDAGLTSSSDASPGADKQAREGASQNAPKESAEASAGNSVKDASPSSAGESGGKPPAPAKADGSDEQPLDPKMQTLLEAKIDARLKSLLESHLEPLLAVNRQLGIFLEEQLDSMLALRQSVAAIERTLEGSPALKKKYEKCLQSVKDEGIGLPEIPWTNRIRGVLSRLQRSGTL